MKRLHIKKKYWIPFVSVLLAVGIYSMFFPLPVQHHYEYRSVVWVECRYCFALSAGEGDSLFFGGIDRNARLVNVSSYKEQATRTNYGQGFWYAPVNLFHLTEKRLLTAASIVHPDTILSTLRPEAKEILSTYAAQLGQLSIRQKKEDSHLDYYMNTHGIHDEGYNQVARYSNQHRQQSLEMQRRVQTVQRLLKADDLRVTYLPAYSYRFTSHDGLLSTKAYPCAKRLIRKGGDIAEFQSLDNLGHPGTLALGYPLINLMGFTAPDRTKRVVLLTYNSACAPQDLRLLTLTPVDGRAWKEKGKATYATSLPILPYSIGAPVTDLRGVLIGIAGRDGIIPVK